MWRKLPLCAAVRQRALLTMCFRRWAAESLDSAADVINHGSNLLGDIGAARHQWRMCLCTDQSSLAFPQMNYALRVSNDSWHMLSCTEWLIPLQRESLRGPSLPAEAQSSRATMLVLAPCNSFIRLLREHFQYRAHSDLSESPGSAKCVTRMTIACTRHMSSRLHT